MKNVIFIHAAILSGCQERIMQFLDLIQKNKLIYEKIFICLVGKGSIEIVNKDIHLIKLSDNLDNFELPTLDFLQKFCADHPEYNILYMHTKGVGKALNPCIEDQIEYMLHFLVKGWKRCVDTLKKHDVCGVDLRGKPTLHYSGNFWWSKSSYIISLPPPIEFSDLSVYPNLLNSQRHNQEFWVCYNIRGNFVSLWDCGIDVYERHLHRYPKHLYGFPNDI